MAESREHVTVKVGERLTIQPGVTYQVIPRGSAEVTHRCPPEGEGLMPCCGLTPYEVPRTDRMTLAEELVTCTGEDRSHSPAANDPGAGYLP